MSEEPSCTTTEYILVYALWSQLKIYNYHNNINIIIYTTNIQINHLCSYGLTPEARFVLTLPFAALGLGLDARDDVPALTLAAPDTDADTDADEDEDED